MNLETLIDIVKLSGECDYINDTLISIEAMKHDMLTGDFTGITVTDKKHGFNIYMPGYESRKVVDLIQSLFQERLSTGQHNLEELHQKLMEGKHEP